MAGPAIGLFAGFAREFARPELDRDAEDRPTRPLNGGYGFAPQRRELRSVCCQPGFSRRL